MDYRGKFEIFDFSKVSTYPISERPNKVKQEDLFRIVPPERAEIKYRTRDLETVVESIIEARSHGRPVIWQMGAHPIKLGFSPIVNDLIKRGVLTLVAGNCATTIHDFELALIGETSENVPNALPEGKFGMAYETGKYMNDALIHGNSLKVGFGESLARMIRGEAFPYKVDFPYKELSVVYTAYENNVPMTVHVSMGTDIIDEHPNFDGEAKGGTSARDFGIYVNEVTKLTEGGVILNVGSAITGPEVFLKSVSMAANVGKVPKGIITADFDLRPIVPEDIRDDTKYTYYFRDIKSVVTRIPEAFGGKGYYIQGNFMETIPSLYYMILERL